MSDVVAYLWQHRMPLYDIYKVEKALLAFLLCIGREFHCSTGAFAWRPVENAVEECLYKFLHT